MEGYQDLDLDFIRGNPKNKHRPFPHQLEAFDGSKNFPGLNNTFTMPINGYKGSLLVLPTGAGKTFTAINWISRNILSRNIKVLWLAQSSYLLNQATKSFIEEAENIQQTRKSLKIRTVSSSKSHANSGSIELSDDVIIVTTQTAINDVLKDTIGFKGEKLKFKLRQWIDNCSDNELFIVLDEAHHAPAYGCRNLLNEIKEIVPNLYVLGLTATPTHMDSRIRGWLEIIFDKGICYQADVDNLYKLNILSRPKYIEKPTGKNMEVDDKLYERIVNQHKDLPDKIIDILASDSTRNNLIINDYINNRDEYRKTIIFADRWFQCEYIAEKLNEKKIPTGSVYSMVSYNIDNISDKGGRRDNRLNEKTLDDFRNNKLEVLVNVKMITEGIDVPDVQTVMITRNTTSSILFTQMMGRALRGKAVGAPKNKEFANIVLFSDNWKRLLPFVNVIDTAGGTETICPVKKGIPPMEWISIMLVRRACRDIEFVGTETYPSDYFLPVGWFETEYVVGVVDEDEIEGHKEELFTESNSVMVYNSNFEVIKNLINALKNNTPEEWASETIDEDEIIKVIEARFSKIIDFVKYDIDGKLKSTVVSIVRHISQNGEEPKFQAFEIRDQYNIDNLVEKYRNLDMVQLIARLKADFQDNRLQWKKLYKKFEWFWQAFADALIRIPITSDSVGPIKPPDPEISIEKYRDTIFKRDNNACRCCGKEMGRGIRLELDHIVPIKMGGTTTLDNLQTLCKTCNKIKGTQLISFLNNVTPLSKPLPFQLLKSNPSEPENYSIKRIINFFFRADVVCNIDFHQKMSGKYYYRWRIIIYYGNPLEWIIPYKQNIIEFIRNELGFKHVYDIEITTDIN